MALSIALNTEFNLELICTLPFLFSKVQAAALNPLFVFKTPALESASIALFSLRLREGKIIHKKSLRAPFTLIFHSEATIDVFHFHFKYQRSNLSVLGMKTRPWKFVDLARNAHDYLYFSSA